MNVILFGQNYELEKIGSNTHYGKVECDTEEELETVVKEIQSFTDELQWFFNKERSLFIIEFTKKDDSNNLVENNTKVS